MNLDFNRNQCIKALKKLGFRLSNKRDGGHDKFIPPDKYNGCNPPFIMIPRHNQLHCQNKILKELKEIDIELFNNFNKII